MRFSDLLFEDANGFFTAFDAWAQGARKTELTPGHWEYRMSHQWLVSLKIETPDHVDITYIKSTVQGSGTGTKVLQALCAAADKAQVKLSLIADESNEQVDWDDDGESFEIPDSRLQAWYARHGFEYTGLSNDYGPEMERLPGGVTEAMLAEMPVRDYTVLGDEKGKSFKNKIDWRMATHPAHIENVKKKFGRIPYDFNIYMINMLTAEKPANWWGGVAQPIDQTFIDQGLPQYRDQIKILPDCINFIVAGNDTYTPNQMRLTPWTLIHRLSHCFDEGQFTDYLRTMECVRTYNTAKEKLQSDLTEIVQKGYHWPFSEPEDYNWTKPTPWMLLFRGDMDGPGGEMLKQVFYALGTMKSARNKNHVTPYESIDEWFAQLMMTGNIKLGRMPDVLHITGAESPIHRDFNVKVNRNVFAGDIDGEVEVAFEHFKKSMHEVMKQATGQIFMTVG